MSDEFRMKVYLIVSSAYGKLDLLLSDTVTAIREIGHNTARLNRYRYEERDE